VLALLARVSVAAASVVLLLCVLNLNSPSRAKAWQPCRGEHTWLCGGPIGSGFQGPLSLLDDWMNGWNRAMCGGARQGAGDMKKSSKSPNDLEQLTSQLDRLGEMKPAELREHWRTLLGAEPPPKLRASC
jgi:hypothetical protein